MFYSALLSTDRPRRSFSASTSRMTFLWILHLFCCCGCLVHPSHAWFTFSPAGRQQPISVVPANVKVLILPGFGNDSSDYYLPQVSQGSLVQSLKSRGWKDEQIRVLPLKRQEWFNVFLRGILDHQFWLGTAPPTRPAFRWYLEKVANSIEELTTGETGNNPKVLLVCHSAGGWLARAALGYGSRDYDTEFAIDLSNVCGVVTLGAPHLPPPPEIMDMTRGALRLTNENFPGAHHANDRIFYMTIVGDAVRGIKQERTNPFEATSVTGFAYNSYEAVCGNGIAIGDGVVPQCAAHLEGATQIDLEGIFHSINVPDRWYGSDNVIDLWHSDMLKLIASSNIYRPSKAATRSRNE